MICRAFTIYNPDLTNQIFLNQFFCCRVSNLIKTSDCVSDNLFSLDHNRTKAISESHLNYFTLFTIQILRYFSYIIKSVLISKRGKNPNATSKSFWTHCTWVEYKQSCVFKPKHSWIQTSSQIRTSWIEQLCYVNNESAQKNGPHIKPCMMRANGSNIMGLCVKFLILERCTLTVCM